MKEKTAGRPSGFAPPAPSCLWASTMTSVPGCPRRGEVRTAGEKPLGVPKSTGWQLLSRAGEGLLGLVVFLEVQVDGRGRGQPCNVRSAWCRGTPSLASGGAPGAGGRASRRASLPPRAQRKVGGVPVVPRRLGLPLEPSVWRPGALLDTLRWPSQHGFACSGPHPRPSRAFGAESAGLL